MMPDLASTVLHLWLDGGRQKLKKDLPLNPLDSGSAQHTMINGKVAWRRLLSMVVEVCFEKSVTRILTDSIVLL
jgi:hypothetical protein